MSLLWTSEASEDLDDAYDFISTFSGIQAADFFLSQLDRELQRLLEFPRSAPFYEDGPWRRLPIQQYMLVFSEDESRLTVHALEHQLRSPDRLRNRLHRR